MGFYHSWLYMRVLNTVWMIWTLCAIVFAFNILCPVILWFVFRGQAVVGSQGVANRLLPKFVRKQTQGKKGKGKRASS